MNGTANIEAAGKWILHRLENDCLPVLPITMPGIQKPLPK